MAEQGTLGAGGQLLLGSTPVAVAYFRAGYTPDDYPTEVEWEARLLIERSDAYACPSAAYQLAGAKKVQQASRLVCVCLGVFFVIGLS